MTNKINPPPQKIPDALKADGFLMGLKNTVYQLWFNMGGSGTGIFPPTLTDTEAAKSTLYYSSTQSKLVYKDSSGVVNALY